MPLLKLQLSSRLEGDKKATVLTALSKLLAEGLNKPEKYVMVVIEDASIIMSGEIGPAAFVDVKSIGGLDGNVNKTMSGKLCAFLKDNLGIPTDKIFINYTDMNAGNWGWNGSTLG